MPRPVDHDRRRRDLAGALTRSLSRHGPDGSALREVAKEAGCSTGAIQHYFRDKDALLLFAAGVHAAALTDRLRARAAAGSPDAPARRIVRAVALELLPLDEERAGEARAGLALTDRAAAAPALASVLREGLARLHELIAGQLRRTPGRGTADRDAQLLLCLVDGLRERLLLGLCDADEAVSLLDHQLDRLLPAGERNGPAAAPVD